MNELITDKLSGIYASGMSNWLDVSGDDIVTVVSMKVPNSTEPIVMIQVVTPLETYRFRAAYVIGFRYSGAPVKTLPLTAIPKGQ